jgi:CheY-like chemotaxis protein
VLICGWIYDEAAGDPEHGIPRHRLGRCADELDLPGVRRAQGRLRDGAGLRFAAANCTAPLLHLQQLQQGSGIVLAMPPWRPASAPGAGTVLVIDDSNTIRRSAEIFLRQGGCEVVLAEDGFDALAKVNDHGPDLIFCDILMPRLDGYQTCAIIKRNPRSPCAGDHAVVQGRPVRQGARPHGGLRGLPDQALHQGPAAARGAAVLPGERLMARRKLTMAIHNILVVDDSKTELHFTGGRAGQARAFGCAPPKTANEALRRIAEEKPDLILMDVVMPGLRTAFS